MTSLIENAFILLILAAPLAAPVHAGQLETSIERGSERKLERFEYKQVHMGVQARIVLYAPDSSMARSAAAAAFDRIAVLDQIMSDYRVDSELMQVAERAGEGPMPVSEELHDVLRISQRVARLSGGAYDVTVGPLVQLWRTARRESRLPSDSSLEAASARTGWRLIRLDAPPQTVELDRGGMRLDLGGIAKGYAADEAIRTLREAGISRALLEFGGDVVASDPPPGRTGWRITVPLADSSARELLLANRAVSTSGDTQQFVDIDGTRYSHVVDPRTGLGLTSRIAVTVVAPRGVLSDALATALSVMGPDEGSAMIARHFPDVDAHFRYIDGREP